MEVAGEEKERDSSLAVFCVPATVAGCHSGASAHRGRYRCSIANLIKNKTPFRIVYMEGV